MLNIVGDYTFVEMAVVYNMCGVHREIEQRRLINFRTHVAVTEFQRRRHFLVFIGSAVTEAFYFVAARRARQRAILDDFVKHPGSCTRRITSSQHLPPSNI
jgi:hypothetical protein